MIAPDDLIYISKVERGDLAAFEMLVKKYQNMVFTVCLRIVKSREDAEEVAQDAFLKAYQNLPTFRRESKFSTWLYSIAYHASLSKIRKKNLEFAAMDEELVENYADDFSIPQMDELVAADQKYYVRAALERLPAVDATLMT